ncbi:MAG: glycerol-3-phosphate 1-O-acyltransferase PlsY [Fusobacteria bacterium]|nr:glycerol-3-phosphate 1-O-acyltransferase PlsY [Fusobacteriota bacterium]
MIVLILIIIAYLLGGLPTALILGKTFKGIDVREQGSKNSGATNAGRVLGKKWFYIVMICDAIKGAIPVILALLFGMSDMVALGIGVVAILGHTYSIYLKFKGGKGVATSLGVIIVLVPLVTIILLIVFVLIYKISNFVSLGSIVCAILFPILIFLFVIFRVYDPSKLSIGFIGIILAAYIVYKHRSNITRIINGNENKTHF